MDNFTYQCQTKVIFGKGTEKQAGEEMKKIGSKVLLHYGGGSIKKSGLYDRVIDSLKASGLEYIELSGVVPNPRLSLVKEGIKLCRENSVDSILAVGGGSVIDSAKAIAAGVPYDGDVWDFFVKKASVEKALPLGTILTISAAGSECSTNSVITNEDEKLKLAMGSEVMRPKFSILNPELSFTLPAFQTACGISDMMAHIMERYFTNTANVDLTDELCEGAMRAIIKNAKPVMEEPDNYDYRAEIMWSSTMAHNGILGLGRLSDWASHMIEHELSAVYDITHGAGLAIIFPAWMKYVYKKNLKRFVRFANKVWGITSGTDEEMALQAIKATEDFFKGLGLPITLKDADIDDKNLEEMSKVTVKFGPVGKFMVLEANDVLEIFKLAL